MRMPSTPNRLVSNCLHWLAAMAFATGSAWAALPSPTQSPIPAGAKLDNASCQQCHDGQKKIEAPDAEGKPRPLTGIVPDKLATGVHGRMLCVDCHTDIANSQVPHRKAGAPKVDCAQCHEKLWADAKKNNSTQVHARLGVVARNIEAYRQSFHARKNADDPSQPNAACHECHDTHFFNVPADKKSPQYAEWRLNIPKLCGKCHDEQLESYGESVHGTEILEKKNAKAAVCIDCHTSHEITATSLAAFKLLHPEECGECHKQNLKSYRDTYHGQVTQLGYTYSAKCFDCHDSHEIKRVKDADSKVHPDNKLKTCKQCHNGKKLPEATAGFVTFNPHAHAGDFERYPQMWIASRFMLSLLLGVFAFFWLHSGLWYYREWQDRKARKAVPHIKTEALGIDETKHFRRFPAGWRIVHLIFALVTMTLVLTGTTALYAHSVWAPWIAKTLGGPHMVGVAHRVAATLFIGIFFIHFVYVMQHLLRARGFRWFGPDSLIPNWKDFKDCWAMFMWFAGRGPKPLFDRWAYFEKFDYWAVFWGVTIIGFSGLMLAFPHVTARYLPGWVFNVATLVHGEEAFLAAVFLFTVHFFNNHFRPDKLPPPDIVMFTGTQ